MKKQSETKATAKQCRIIAVRPKYSLNDLLADFVPSLNEDPEWLDMPLNGKEI